MGILRRFWTGAWSLLVGLRVTVRHLVRPTVTLLYPYQKPDASKWNGPIELVTFPETGTHDCIACNACVRVCPSDCITVEGKRPEGSKKMRATKFLLDFSTCSLCGLCVDVCPTDTLRYSTRYDEAFYTRGETINDLLKPFGEDPPFAGKPT
ncbi:MAG: NADH-quinone oxidoreductase subunit I [Gemmatimonadales bacterium]|jgi:NADH-quinone oxidoreductase subunit I